MNITNFFDPEGFKIPKKLGKYKSQIKELAEPWGAKQLGFYIKIMEPKTFSAPYHWHTGEEEMIIVIEGSATVHNNGEFRVLKPGDLVYYNTGADSVHHMYNHTDEPFKYFVLSNTGVEDECYYPDSKKQSSPNGFMQDGKEVDYYKDEEDPSIYWPKDRL